MSYGRSKLRFSTQLGVGGWHLNFGPRVPLHGQKSPKMAKILFRALWWSKTVRSAWNKVGTSYRTSRLRFSTELGVRACPQESPKGTKWQKMAKI